MELILSNEELDFLIESLAYANLRFEESLSQYGFDEAQKSLRPAKREMFQNMNLKLKNLQSSQK